MATNLFGELSVNPVQAGFGFPEPLTEKYRPRKIGDFVGLDRPKKILSNLAAKPFASAWLMVGPSGTGKTTMALALADAIPAQVHLIPSQCCNVEAIERLRHELLYMPRQGCRFHLVLCDEADCMTVAAQNALLSLLDSTGALPNVIWVFTANSTDRLEQRFISRCKTLEFSSYGLSAGVAALLERVWNQETDSPNRPNFARLVKDSANNVRASLQALELALLES
jgi:DNA polymerase III gamma/tau subunit